MYQMVHDDQKLLIANVNVEKQHVQIFYMATFYLKMTVQEPEMCNIIKSVHEECCD
jgi:hypothetical protein